MLYGRRKLSVPNKHKRPTTSTTSRCQYLASAEVKARMPIGLWQCYEADGYCADDIVTIMNFYRQQINLCSSVSSKTNYTYVLQPLLARHASTGRLPAPTGTTYAWRRVRCDAGPRLRSIACGLLHYCSRRCTQVTHRQAPAGTEHLCSCCQQHAKARPRTVWVTAWRTALVGLWIYRSESTTNSAWLSSVHRCMQRKAPPYLADLCTPVSDIASRQHLRFRIILSINRPPPYRLKLTMFVLFYLCVF